MQQETIRVLVADNNPDLRSILKTYIDAQPDMEVAGLAGDGHETLEQIVSTRPHVVLLDIAMPRLDGIGVLERLGSVGISPLPRIIVLTALSGDEVMRQLSDLGADYYVVKPIDLDVLGRRIRQFGGATFDTPTVAGERQPDTRPEIRASRSEGRMQAESVSTVAAAGETGTYGRRIAELLHQLGVPANMKGYLYLRDAVEMVLSDDRLLAGSLTRKVYPLLAERYGSSASGVEAAIRNALVAWWERGNRELYDRMPGRSGKRSRLPTNSSMIAELADQIRFEGSQARPPV